MSISCISCNRQIRDGIYNSTFYPNILIMLSAFFALALIVALLTYWNRKRHRSRANWSSVPDPVPMGTAALVLGIGLGGFADGIILHQILQWHEMLSARIPATDYIGKSVNMFWDGIFHAFCLVVVLIGIVLFWRSSRIRSASKSGKLLAGGMLSGWAIFNLVEGAIDHHWLKLHNVMEYSSNHDLANWIFMGVSVLMLLIGMWLSRIFT